MNKIDYNGVDSMDTLLQLWVQEPSIDHTRGTVLFCFHTGSPHEEFLYSAL